MLGQPYCRTSTDDKDQDPWRQMDVIRPWAERENIGLLPPVIDEGTSAYKVSPFERATFRQAVSQAVDHKATCIVIESVDRMTREGIEMWYRTSFRLDDDYGLKVRWADMPLAAQEGWAAHMILAVRAGMAHDFSRTLSKRVKGGMERARAKGQKMGRPPKPIAPEEIALAIRLKPKMGWEKITAEINRRRGVHLLADPRARKKRATSAPAVRRAVLARQAGTEALQNIDPTKVPEVIEG